MGTTAKPASGSFCRLSCGAHALGVSISSTAVGRLFFQISRILGHLLVDVSVPCEPAHQLARDRP
jgi:hypothetical protein